MAKALRKTCRYCSTKIPYGKNFCYTHYQAELVDYRAKLKQYEAEMRGYEKLLPEELEQHRKAADEQSIGIHAFISGALTGLLVWYALAASGLSDGLFAVLFGGGAAVLVTAIRPVRLIFGKLSRSLLHATLYYAILFAIVFVLTLVSAIVDSNRTVIYVGLIPVCLLISMIMEFSGNHKPTLMPVKPIPPNP